MFEPILFNIEKDNQSNFSFFELKLNSGRRVRVFIFLIFDRVWCVHNPHIRDGIIYGFVNSLGKQVIIPLMDGICVIQENEQRKLIMQRETYLSEMMFLEHREVSFGELFSFEAGVFALAHNGDLLWKNNIFLNEKFKEERADEIVFENAQDDYELLIDKKSGEITR